jgi:signal peptidase I
MKKVLIFLWETLQVIVISLAIIIPVRYYLIQPFFVKGASMEPNFDDGQYLIIDELSYRLGKPQRGDVIIFKYPNDPRQYYIKRIIGLPGETIEIKNNQIIILSSAFPSALYLDESSYLADNEVTGGDSKVSLSDTQYFVLGDNRQASYDSRRWGPLEKNFIIGKVWLRAWPLTKAALY